MCDFYARNIIIRSHSLDCIDTHSGNGIIKSRYETNRVFLATRFTQCRFFRSPSTQLTIITHNNSTYIECWARPLNWWWRPPWWSHPRPCRWTDQSRDPYPLLLYADESPADSALLCLLFLSLVTRGYMKS